MLPPHSTEKIADAECYTRIGIARFEIYCRTQRFAEIPLRRINIEGRSKAPPSFPS